MSDRLRAPRVTKRRYGIRDPQILAELVEELVERAGSGRRLAEESGINVANVSHYRRGRRTEMAPDTAGQLVGATLLLQPSRRDAWMDRWRRAVTHPGYHLDVGPWERSALQLDYDVDTTSACSEATFWFAKLQRRGWSPPPTALTNRWLRIPHELSELLEGEDAPDLVRVRVGGYLYACTLGRLQRGRRYALRARHRDVLGWETLEDMNTGEWRHQCALRPHLGAALLAAV